MRNIQTSLRCGRRQRRGFEEGSDLVARYVESGETQHVFARKEGISVSNLKYWLRQVAAHGCGDEATIRDEEQSVNGCPRELSLLEVQIARGSAPGTRLRESGPDNAAYEIDLPNGVRLRVGAGFLEGDMRRLLVLLREEVRG